jgi:hypothetical protein
MESEKPPEPEGPSGFSTRNLAASVLALSSRGGGPGLYDVTSLSFQSQPGSAISS